MTDLLNYKGKKVVVTGASSGIGEATAKMLIDQGAEVYALDIKEPKLPVENYIPINLASKASIDEVIEKLPNKLDRIFNCAGLPGTTYGNSRFTSTDVITVNFLGPKHLIESLIPRLPEEGAVTIVASLAGMGWADNIDVMSPIVDIPSMEEGQVYFEKNEKELLEHYNHQPIPDYTLSKELVVFWVKKNAYRLSEKKIRINVVSPAPVRTPMTKDFDSLSKVSTLEDAISKVGRPAEPEDLAKALLFVNSDLASYVSGLDLHVGYGVAPFMQYQFS